MTRVLHQGDDGYWDYTYPDVTGTAGTSRPYLNANWDGGRSPDVSYVLGTAPVQEWSRAELERFQIDWEEASKAWPRPYLTRRETTPVPIPTYEHQQALLAATERELDARTLENNLLNGALRQERINHQRELDLYRYGAERRAKAEPRIGDQERGDALDRLATAYTTGHLTQAEWDQRSMTALKAVTATDLTPLTIDLPAPRAPEPVPVVKGRSLGAWYWRLTFGLSGGTLTLATLAPRDHAFILIPPLLVLFVISVTQVFTRKH